MKHDLVDWFLGQVLQLSFGSFVVSEEDVSGNLKEASLI